MLWNNAYILQVRNVKVFEIVGSPTFHMILNQSGAYMRLREKEYRKLGNKTPVNELLARRQQTHKKKLANCFAIHNT